MEWLRHGVLPAHCECPTSGAPRARFVEHHVTHEVPHLSEDELPARVVAKIDAMTRIDVLAPIVRHSASFASA